MCPAQGLFQSAVNEKDVQLELIKGEKFRRFIKTGLILHQTNAREHARYVV